MKLIPPLPPWHPPALPGAGHRLAAASIGQVIGNTTACITGILAAGGRQRAPAAGPAQPAVTAALTAALQPAAAPSPSPAPAAGTGSCGLLDYTCFVTRAITGWFAGLVRSAVNPLLAW